MRALLQRVARASVRVDGELIGENGPDLVIFVGIAQGDSETDIGCLVEKLTRR